MSIKEQIVVELDRLSEAELEHLARYLAFLRYQARLDAAPAVDEQQLASLYAEFGKEDRELAEEGLADYVRGLDEEDRQ